MTDEKLEKAMDLKDSMKALRDMRRTFCAPYPKILVQDPEDCYTVSFYNLDAATQTEFKKIIIEYLDRRFKEIEKEYKEL